MILVGAMFPISQAMQVSGAANELAELLVDVVGDSGNYALLIALFVLTAVLGQLISNTATLLVVAPIALSAAAELGVSAQPLLMMVNLAAAAAFLTPVATPVNLMVMGPGGYRFGDYWKLGGVLMLWFLIVGRGRSSRWRGRSDRLRGEHVEAQRAGQEARHELAAHAVAGSVERRREGAEPALARRDRHDAAADAALARDADVEQPVARRLVEAGGRHRPERVAAGRGRHDPRAGERVDAAVGERRAHDGEVARA